MNIGIVFAKDILTVNFETYFSSKIKNIYWLVGFLLIYHLDFT